MSSMKKWIGYSRWGGIALLMAVSLFLSFENDWFLFVLLFVSPFYGSTAYRVTKRIYLPHSVLFSLLFLCGMFLTMIQVSQEKASYDCLFCLMTALVFSLFSAVMKRYWIQRKNTPERKRVQDYLMLLAPVGFAMAWVLLFAILPQNSEFEFFFFFAMPIIPFIYGVQSYRLTRRIWLPHLLLVAASLPLCLIFVPLSLVASTITMLFTRLFAKLRSLSKRSVECSEEAGN